MMQWPCIEQHKPIVLKVQLDFSHRSKEEKAAEKDRLGVVQDKFGFCMMDAHKQKVANFRYMHKVMMFDND